MSKFVITHHTGETKPAAKFKGAIPTGHDWAWRLLDDDGETVVKSKRMMESEEACREEIARVVVAVHEAVAAVRLEDIEVETV